MHAFSRQASKDRAIEIKIRRAHTLAKQGTVWYVDKHNDEVKDAQKGNFIKLDTRIKKECQEKQKRNEIFKEKLHATD